MRDGGIFINYRTADSRYAADLLHLGLSQVVGADRVFLDSASIPPGADFADTLLNRVRASRVVLAVIGRNWLSHTGPDGQRSLDDPADWIHRELAAALEARVPIIPVLTDGASAPTEADLPADLAPLARRQAVPLRPRATGVDLHLLVGELRQQFPTLVPAHWQRALRRPARRRAAVLVAAAAAVVLAAGLTYALTHPTEHAGSSAPTTTSTPPPPTTTSSTPSPVRVAAPTTVRVDAPDGAPGQLDDLWIRVETVGYTSSDNGTVDCGGAGGVGTGQCGAVAGHSSGVTTLATVDFTVTTPAITCRASAVHVDDSVVVTEPTGAWSRIVLRSVGPGEQSSNQTSVTFEVSRATGGPAPQSPHVCARN